jgi:hypothetical protein
MGEYDDFEDKELDEFDEFDDADDDELFEKESAEEDFEERMSRETEAYLKGADDGFSDASAGIPFYYPTDDDYDDEMSEGERHEYDAGYYDGYDSEEDLDE